jgi:Fe-S cluster biogenesis protein NfuA
MDQHSIEKKINESLDAVRPFLQLDRGDVEFVKFDRDGIVEVRLLGACKLCPMSAMTLRAGIERALMRDLPEVKRVESIP